MSSYSLPSSPESVSDEDNRPKDRPWYEADYTSEEVESPKRERSPSPPFVHNPKPSLTAHNDLSPKTIRRLKELERLEKKELKAEEKKQAKEDVKAMRASIKRVREREEERMRAENRRVRVNKEMEYRAAEWK